MIDSKGMKYLKFSKEAIAKNEFCGMTIKELKEAFKLEREEAISSERERTAKEIFDKIDEYIESRLNTITDLQRYDKIKNEFFKKVKSE